MMYLSLEPKDGVAAVTTQPRSLNEARDTEICRLYAEELWTLEACGQQYGLSRQRVKQILKSRGVWRGPIPKPASDHTEFLGVFLTEEDKIALKEEADRSGVSLSALVRALVRNRLTPQIEESKP